MKNSRRKILVGIVAWLFVLGMAALPVFAADDAAPDPTDTPVGLIFRWFNFLVVFGVIGYVMVKVGGPYFRAQAESIYQSIQEAAATKAAAEREVAQADQRLAHLQAEIADMRSAAKKDAVAETERIKTLTRSEIDKINKAAQAEINAAERAGQAEMRAIAARVATEKALVLLGARMNPATQATLFNSFVGKLERSAS